ncbi:hypothetical protein CBR_g77558 [Chara braunii]|uniref:Uncharacterized protein n=1 Tax=Chara braunii TaxID=69332 RepID=A0A388JK86_CHABU|nr:hypothetical protein CBR_g77558 [Chara braunii]|eukprot:GBG44028.1 hypothetical protein CBR_g77558 [Chara braunii]
MPSSSPSLVLIVFSGQKKHERKPSVEIWITDRGRERRGRGGEGRGIMGCPFSRTGDAAAAVSRLLSLIHI